MLVYFYVGFLVGLISRELEERSYKEQKDMLCNVNLLIIV